MFHKNNFTIIDVETTGGSPFFSRVIEIGLLKVEKGEVVEEFQTLVNPGQDIPEFITKMTGIDNQAVSKAPVFSDIADDLLTKFEDAIFVAHNVAFDYGFIKEEYRRLGYGFNLDRLCTVRLSRALFKEHKRHNLSILIERYGFEIKNRHRAFDDAKVLWDFMQMLQKDMPEQLDKTMQQLIIKNRYKTKKPLPEIIYENEAGEIIEI
jgi:DNA polymerase III subunit epsilon